MLHDLYSLVSGLPRGSPKMDRLNLRGHERHVDVHCDTNTCTISVQSHELTVPKDGFRPLHITSQDSKVPQGAEGITPTPTWWKAHMGLQFLMLCLAHARAFCTMHGACR